MPELLVLAIHDQLRFCAIPAQIFEMTKLLFVRLGQELVSLFKICNGAGLMVHDRLDFAAVGEKRIEPDLPDLERGIGLFGLRSAAQRVNAGSSERVYRR